MQTVWTIRLGSEVNCITKSYFELQIKVELTEYLQFKNGNPWFLMAGFMKLSSEPGMTDQVGRIYIQYENKAVSNLVIFINT